MSTVSQCWRKALKGRGTPKQRMKRAARRCQPEVVRKWARSNPAVRRMLKRSSR